MVDLLEKIPFIILLCNLLAWIPSVKTQGFENTGTNDSGLVGSYVNLTWNFNSENYGVVRTRWLGTDNSYILTKLPGQPPEYPGYEDKLEYVEPFVLRIFGLQFPDSGSYTCEITLNNSQLYLHPINLTVYNFSGNLEHEIKLFDYQKPIEDDLTLGQDFQAIVQVPANDPPAVAVKIAVQYVDSRFDYEDELSFLSGGPASFNVTASSIGLINITSLMEHPLSANGFTSTITIEVIDPNLLASSLAPDDTSVRTDNPPFTEDPNILTSSLAPDDTSVSTYTPPPTEDHNTLTSSLAPGDTSVSTDTLPSTEDGFTGNKSESDKGPDDPGAECKWWCILLIVLAVLAILGIIVGLMYHYRLACFRSKPSAQIDVNQKQETNGFGMENKAY